MKLAFTLHRINGDIMPGQVVELSIAQIEELVQFGAVRKPTDDEIALYRMSNPVTDNGQMLVEKPVINSTSEYRAGLEKRATDLDVKFGAKLGDAKLLERVEAAEKFTSTDDILGE